MNFGADDLARYNPVAGGPAQLKFQIQRGICIDLRRDESSSSKSSRKMGEDDS